MNWFGNLPTPARVGLVVLVVVVLLCCTGFLSLTVASPTGGAGGDGF